MNNKQILIESNSEEQLVEALQSFANMYCSQEFSQSIELAKGNSNLYVVTLPGVDEEHFRFAVNYLRYPENETEFKSVRGYDHQKKLMYYIPLDDTEYDNCYTVSEDGEGYKHSFTGASEKISGGASYIPYSNIGSKLVPICTVAGVKPVKKGLFSWLFG
jgi:hypothetical protein